MRGVQYPRTVSTTRWSNGNPPWISGARSGHGTLTSRTSGSAEVTARSYARVATVVGVASSPMRPLRVAATASTDSGWTTPTTSTGSVVSIRWRWSAGSADDVAALHATTSSLAPDL